MRCIKTCADPIGHAVYVVGLRPLACWNCGFESRWELESFLFRVLCLVR